MFGMAGRRLFGSRLLPSTRPSAGVVVCSPIHGEFPKNYRREVLMSRVLARRGLAVQRFHYGGAGHSDGESAQLSFDTMCEDVGAAADQLRNAAGITRVALLGTRVGALAAAATADAETAAIALWEPVVDVGSYVRQAYRARIVSDLRRGRSGSASSQSFDEQMRAQGCVDVLGYQIERSLYESLEGHDLSSELRRCTSPVLLVQFGGSEHLRDEYTKVTEHLASHGVAVTAAVAPLEVSWWLQSELWRRDAESASQAPLHMTADWVAGILGRSDA
ncbi:MAG TPA: alpha/beta hydrolase [Acidimicrobiales bacterium]|nr:alpha/beta hydrolase [Acidimicrobiales bacterium]